MLEDEGEALKVRLRADLRVALKERDTIGVRVLRALVAAIDNAEAPPLATVPKAIEPVRFADRSAEMERLLLSRPKALAVLAVELQERERSAELLERLNLRDRADVLRAEASRVRRYLD